MLVFRRLIALFAPVDGVSQVYVFRALFARKHSLGELKQALMTLDTLHEGFGDKFTTVLGWALAHRHFLLLESMHMGRIRFVALHAEGEVLTRHAIKPKHLLRYRLHALITAEPEIVAVLEQPLLSRVMSLLSDRLTHPILEVKLGLFVVGGEVLMHIFVDLLAPILQQSQVDGFVGLDFVLVGVGFVLVVALLAEHLCHGLVVDVGDELGLELLLYALN